MTFQSTLPVKGATQTDRPQTMVVMVSIHAPGEGSDLVEDVLRGQLPVSIHAPGEGSDRKALPSVT